MATPKVNESSPLLPPPAAAANSTRLGRASIRKTYANIIISILGSGVLGLPFAYRVSGWGVATSAIVFSGLLAYYCMMLLVSCRDTLASKGHHFVQTYPDLGYQTYGALGRRVIEITLLVSQVGCCVAYLIFIAHNISSVFFPEKESRYLIIILLLVPLQILVACIRSLSTLAPFSIFANFCNILAMAIVIKDDVSRFQGLKKITRFTGWGGIPFALGVCIYCYEGFGMTLSLQSSMRKPHKFGRVLALAFMLITCIYLLFGFAGYIAFGNETQDIITLNLNNEEWSTKLVKVGLSVALFFTFPVMMYPVYEIVETRMVLNEWFQKRVMVSARLEKIVMDVVRGLAVIGVALIAVAVPGFGTFISLVGSTVCALLAFVFPALFHYKICSDHAGFLARALDVVLVVFGALFASYGTYQACTHVFHLSS